LGRRPELLPKSTSVRCSISSGTSEKNVLERAKDALRKAFHRDI
jgi:hypothetical protein